MRLPSQSLSTLAGALALSATALAAETPLERGAYLVEGPAACGSCHTAPMPGAAPLAGRTLVEPAFTAEVPNITPGSRIADWSDAELVRAIREGIRPDGSVIGPPMPIMLYRHLSDSDVTAMVTYLRTVPAVETKFKASTYPFPLPPAYGPPIDSVADVPREVSVAYGEYLAGPVAHCLECHSLKDGMPDLDGHLGGGGHTWEGPWGVSVAANLTSHEDGLADYSDAEIATMITQGIRPDGSQMHPPMSYRHYAYMTEDDVAALILYLRTLPPIPDGG
ncbi:Alcohol dehydrogenase cytochrome c subunit precursor [Pseudooceanicola marinus]|uniref:Alcohol dehydrogenase cytochrome c subunit n=1 Tax=Pseudooceanicola marinus TaxID=396013 RepID=A0A1X7A5J3_9RHOB|nr:cytochrome c [Pseudooceanicola marinus]PJE31165.1 cytochrome C [Pseudooceanicola marinus]SLN69195.1 Alcohol dehydrogenase cytochrome c subunit precursor [Pseudooceanicola marinus]